MQQCKKDTEVIEPEAPPAVDINGYTCEIIQDIEITNPLQYLENSLFADALLERITKVEEIFGCNIELRYEGVKDSSLSQLIISNITAGTNIGEIIYSFGNNISSNMAYADCLYPLTELKDIINYEDSEKYGSAAVLETAMLNSIPYIVSPVAWTEKQPNGCTYLVVINEAIIKQYNFTDPRELVEQSQWTWNKFEELLPMYTLQDGEKTTYAFHSFPHYLSKMAVLSNGVRIVDDVDGTVKTDIYSEKAIDALNWVKKIITDYKDNVIIKGASWEDSYMPFANGETVMCLTNTGSVVTKVSFLADDFGIVPFPCGPKGEYGKWASVLEGVEGAGILVNAEEPEYAAHIISEMFEPFEGYEGREGLLDYYIKQIFYDRRDAETYLDISKYGKYSYWPVGGDTFWGSVGSGVKSKTGSELVQKFGPQLEKVVDEYISTNYEYMKDHLYN